MDRPVNRQMRLPPIDTTVYSVKVASLKCQNEIAPASVECVLGSEVSINELFIRYD